MPEKKTTQRARRDRRAGKKPSTQAGNYVAEEMRHKKSGKHPVKNRKQAIAIGLSKARRSGVKVPRKSKTAKRSGTSGKTSRSRSSTRSRTPSASRRRSTGSSRRSGGSSRRSGGSHRSGSSRRRSHSSKR